MRSNLILNQSSIAERTRCNHGLEHATIHVLAARGVARTMAGYSTPGGFFLVGRLETEGVVSAVNEALQRLLGGQRGLAVHPGCGTNYAVSGVLAGALTLATAGLGGRRRSKLEQLSNAAFAATIGVVIGQSLGRWLQANVTTSSDMTGVRIARVTKLMDSPVTLHFVATDRV